MPPLDPLEAWRGLIVYRPTDAVATSLPGLSATNLLKLEKHSTSIESPITATVRENNSSYPTLKHSDFSRSLTCLLAYIFAAPYFQPRLAILSHRKKYYCSPRPIINRDIEYYWHDGTFSVAQGTSIFISINLRSNSKVSFPLFVGGAVDLHGAFWSKPLKILVHDNEVQKYIHTPARKSAVLTCWSMHRAWKKQIRSK